MDVIVPFQRKNRSDIIYDTLHDLIRNGRWKPGEKFPTEMELCKLFNVGRSTIREALNHLKASNLIHVAPGVGAFVTNPSAVEQNILARHIPEEQPLIFPAISAFLTALTGLLFQLVLRDTVPVPVYFLRIVLAAGAGLLFPVALGRRTAVTVKPRL